MNHKPTNPTKYEGVIRHIAVCLANRQKDKAKHHLNRILPHLNDMTAEEEFVVNELRLRIYC